MEQHIFGMSLITEGATEKVTQFKMPLMKRILCKKLEDLF
jgi:hypothetical protein